MTRTTFSTFDAVDQLDNDEVIAAYLSAAMEDENPDILLVALLDVAKARGMARVASDAGLGRESLYKALAAGAKPRFETVAAVLRALGIKLVARPRAPIRKGGARKVKRAAQAA